MEGAENSFELVFVPMCEFRTPFCAYNMPNLGVLLQRCAFAFHSQSPIREQLCGKISTKKVVLNFFHFKRVTTI